MEKQHFNPIIETIVSIRQLAIASSENWTAIKTAGSTIEKKINEASVLIKQNASNNSLSKWETHINNYKKNLSHLKMIMNAAISKIKEKKANNISEDWEHYHQYSKEIIYSFKKLKALGKEVLPENTYMIWDSLWLEINDNHIRIQNEADACSIQLKMIEEYTPKEIDELSDTILKHIPIKYSKEEANLYTSEYMNAYEAIKKEATQKKNVWDRFLDILAGGTSQTPAQKVMMQRWVDGEKGELH